jgi:hypothetical protein
MYVIAERGGGMTLTFGLAPKKAETDLIRRDIRFDGPPLETYRCSPGRYRTVKAEDKDRFILSQCRTNSNGIAVLAQNEAISHLEGCR